MKYFGSYLLVLLVALFGCSETGTEMQDPMRYFPLEVGQYWIYQVNGISYTETAPPSAFTYDLRIRIVDSFVNSSDETVFVLYRDKRESEVDPWLYINTSSARVSGPEVVVIEENLPIIKLQLPPDKNRVWNANGLNLLPEDLYRVSSTNKTFQTDQDVFKNCIVINQESYFDNLLKDEREEIYCLDVGLVSRTSVVLNYCDDVDCFGQQIVKSGEEYYQVLKSYGKE